MRLELHRKEFYDDRTIGGLYIDGPWFCHTLEDTDRKLEDGGHKIAKLTAIPRGKYTVVIDYSGRFERDMPHILDVPQFTGIRIHAGNRPEDTEGCPLLGFEYDVKNHMVLTSRAAFDKFFILLKYAIDEGEEATLEIT